MRGQYVAGVVDGETVKSYDEERGQDSDTETFVAIRADIDNWRWAGVPFFLRTGKRLPEKRTEIVIQFKPLPHSIFDYEDGEPEANKMIIELQPDEDISLTVMNKKAGLDSRMQLQPIKMSLSWGFRTKSETPPRRRIAYERLLLDALKGDSTLFVRRDEAEQAWKWVDEVSEAWVDGHVKPQEYAAGSWGPDAADMLMLRTGREWNTDQRAGLMVEIETFPTVETWAASIAGRLEETLGAAVIANGKALFAGPGGSTPSPVYARLAQADIGWSDIAVTLVDERYVPETSPESNARLIRDVLLQGPAAAGDLHPAVHARGHGGPRRPPSPPMPCRLSGDGSTPSCWAWARTAISVRCSRPARP